MSLFALDEYVDGERDSLGVLWCRSSPTEVNRLLNESHYLGPRDSGMVVFAGIRDEEVVAAQIWGAPSSRNLPSDGSWLELARWCLTPQAGPNAGSRQHRHVVRWLRQHQKNVTTLVSYSDPSQGHTGALYRACNWEWYPTWHRINPPPTGNGRWSADAEIQSVKDRWIYPVRTDARRSSILSFPDYAVDRVRSSLSRDWHPWQRSALERQLSLSGEVN